MITIKLNDHPVEIGDNFNILQLLEQVKSPINGIAIAINSEIIPQKSWKTVALKPNDQLLIIQATQGG